MPEYLNSRPNWSSVDVPAADAAEAAGEAAADAASEAAGDGGWNTTGIVLVGSAAIALLIIAYLVYTHGESSGTDDPEEQQGGQQSRGAHDAHSGQNEAWVSGGSFETIESGGGLVEAR